MLRINHNFEKWSGMVMSREFQKWSGGELGRDSIATERLAGRGMGGSKRKAVG